MKKELKFIGLLYLFIFAIELIKKVTSSFSLDIKSFLMQNLNPIKSVAVGWFTTSIVQSSDVVGTITAAFTGNGLISLSTAVYILIGASLGTTITAIVISLITSARHKRDFRHGFEIGLSYAIYSALLVIIVLFLEYFFKVFSKTSFFLASKLQKGISLLKIPNLTEAITSPIINLFFTHLNKILLLLIGFGILIFVLRFIGKSIIELLGGEEKAQKIIKKSFGSKYKAYFLGFITTAIVFSSSITVGLLVPLATARLISLRKAIPFILGADVGTFSSVFLASIMIGEINALAASLNFLLFGIIGGIIFLPNTKVLYKMTKYVSKRLIKISRKKALILLVLFILIPLLIILL